MKRILLSLLICNLIAVSGFAQATSGTCGAEGDNLTWNFNSETGVLSISGTGEMADYTASNHIPWYSFRTQIIQVEIEDGVENIGAMAFYNCTGFTSITIPDGVKSIGNYAFNSCTDLVSIDIPNSVTSIGVYAFNGTSWYNDQPDGCVYIGKVLYAYKGAMPANTTVEVAAGTLGIGAQAFSGCANLVSIDISDGVINIGNHAFYECTGLASIDIPESVTSIGNYVFYKCTNLTAINVEENNPNYASQDGVLFSKKEEKITLLCFPCGKPESNYTIPDGITDIGDGAFLDCTKLTSIDIPNSVTGIIGDNAFSGCAGLISIDIPDDVTNIGDFAFYNCSSLSSLEIPDGVTNIGMKAFYRCAFTSAAIPEGVTSIGDNAFQESALTTVNYNAVNCIRMGSFDTWTFDGPVFSDCNLSVINIGDKVENIPDYAFYSTPVTTITIPNSVTSIGNNAFGGCTELASIDIGENVINVGDYTFGGCADLTSIDIPSSVTSIGERAFAGCKNLITINVVEDNVNYISKNGVLFNSALTMLICCPGAKLGKYTVPEGITNIAEAAFLGCKSLTSIILPGSVTDIGIDAFYGCSGFTSLICRMPEPPIVTDREFRLIDRDICKLYVPVGSKQDYEKADGWKHFTIEEKDFISTEPDAVVAKIQISAQSCGIVVAGIAQGEAITVYNAAGMLVATAVADEKETVIPVSDKGVYIVRTSGKATKIVL